MMMDAALKPTIEYHWPEVDFQKAWLPEVARDLETALAYHNQGALEEAQKIYRQILQQDPEHSDALHLSGIIAYQIGKNSIAIRLITRAIRNQPENPYYHTNLGSVFQSDGQYDKAAACYHKAIHLKPDYAAAYFNMGNVKSAENHYKEAIGWYQEALRIVPDDPDGCYNMANSYKKLGMFDQSILWYEAAIQIRPDHAESFNNMGNAYATLNKWENAMECYQKALVIFPDYPEALYNLAHGCQFRGKIKEAVFLYQKTLAINPEYAEVYNNIGNIFKDLGMISDAVTCYRKVLSLKPDFLEAINNMGNCFLNMGQHDEAVKYYRTALAIEPDSSTACSNLLYSLNFQEGLDENQVFKEHWTWGMQQTKTVKPLELPKPVICSPDRCLRIGYVSPDFRDHSVACFIEPLIMGHDRSFFQVVCYSDASVTDLVTERLKSRAGQWWDICGLSDIAAAERIRQDRIDILVDLAGHTANNRLGVFARKPSPIQLSYLGYPNTTGLPAIQYRITDSWADPPGMTDHLYTENLIRLSSGFLCYQPKVEISINSKVQTSSNGTLTFGSFNQRAKITPHVISVWARILSQVPHAEMILKSKAYQDDKVQKQIIDDFSRHGIAPERIKFLSHQASDTDHLNSYQNIDISLDPFPYNGTTTTCDALWMGVPVITLAGKTHVSRVGVSLLSSINRKELIADSEDEYIRKSIVLGKNPEQIQEYRNSLRPAMLGSSLMDRKKFCATFEKALKEIWKVFLSS
ncbi:MAG: hypothetical protein C0403_13650 [Desulfobacterium sp.]|nr:hypothetical protein [Desulfobacterium sp.]